MLCSPRMGRMAAMERLLLATGGGNLSEISPEEANRQKLAAKTIRMELSEADEANLLEEADMHVFDCKPMTDPLHLVRCNACKKPVKTSQYAAHAERCGQLISSEDVSIELECGAGNKKPPRRGRKKASAALENQASIVDQDRSESLDGEDTAFSELANMDETHAGSVSCLTRELKGSSPSIDGTTGMDGSGVCTRTNHSAGVAAPKRAKFSQLETMPQIDGLDQHGVTSDDRTCSQRVALGGPAPLATKIYSFPRNQLLRSALGQMFREAVLLEQTSASVISELPRSSPMPQSLAIPPATMVEAPRDVINLKKRDAFVMPAVQNPDQIFAQRSEMFLGVSGGYPSTANLPNQFRDSNFARAGLSIDPSNMGMMRKGYLSAAYHMNPGIHTGTIQQPASSIPTAM